MNFPIIAFTGLAGSGKSTAARALVDQLGFVRVSFADPLRQMLEAIGISREQMGVGKHVPLDWLDGRTPRQLLQTLGTEWGRQLVHPDIWIKVAARRVDAFRATSVGGVVFDDCRFDNEALMIRQLCGQVIKIDREGLTSMIHASEAGVSESLLDATIENQWDETVFSGVVVKMVGRLASEKAACTPDQITSTATAATLKEVLK